MGVKLSATPVQQFAIAGVGAPMGCGFPVEAWKGKEHRADYAGITILYGATHPTNFTYWYDVKEWQKRDAGMVPTVLERMGRRVGKRACASSRHSIRVITSS